MAGDGRADPVTEAAPAKLNLYLRVTGRRADGYHELDSWVAFASVGDTVAVQSADALTFGVDGPFAGAVPDGSDNLAYRAVADLARALGRSPDVAIRLTKNLPVAAGIGGGSSDAAAVLRAMVRLWSSLPGRQALAGIAERLGADVPACLRATSCFMGGIGEHLDPAPSVTGCPVVLANPGIAVPTATVFRARAGVFSAPARPTQSPGGPVALAKALSESENDLAEPAKWLFPEVAAVQAALAGRPGCLLARMSGSGGTCFGLFETADAANAAARDLSERHAAWWARAGHLL